MIEFIFDYADESLTSEQEEVMKRAVETALKAEGFEFDCEISVVITDNSGIREINREHRNIDAHTDVLSFPQYDFVSPTVFAEELIEPVMLGDIVISKERLAAPPPIREPNTKAKIIKAPPIEQMIVLETT